MAALRVRILCTGCKTQHDIYALNSSNLTGSVYLEEKLIFKGKEENYLSIFLGKFTFSSKDIIIADSN